MVLRGLFYMHKAAFFNSIKVYEIYDILCHTMAEIEYIICIGKQPNDPAEPGILNKG